MFAFSLMALFTRQADAPFLTVAAWRALLVALIFGGWTVLASPERLEALKPDRRTAQLGAIYGLLLALASSTFVGGYAFTTVANTIFLHNLAPIAAFPLAWWFFREKPLVSALSGAAVATVGVALLSGVSLFHFSHFSHPRFLAGDSLALISALGYAGVLVCTRATRREGTPILATLFVAWSVAAVVLVVLALLLGTMAISASGLLWVLGLAVICTNLPFYLLNLGMKQVGAGMAAVLSMSEVLFATLLGWIVFGEVLAPVGWLGGVLVIIGVLYALLARDSASDPEQQPVPEPLSEPARRLRLARLVLWLGLLNGAALLALLGGFQVGLLLAWIALLGMLRCAQPLLPGLLGGLAPTVGRYSSAALAAALLAALVWRGGWSAGSASWAGVALGLLVFLVDIAIAAREPVSERDPATTVRAALLLVALGQCLALVEHSGSRVLLVLGAAATAMGAWGLALDALAQRQPAGAAGAASSSSRMDALVALLRSPPRLAAGLVLVYLIGGLSTVPPGARAIVERLGAPLQDLSDPGLLLRLPPPLERVILVDVAAVRRVDIAQPETPLLCGDHAMVAVQAVGHYRVSDPLSFAFQSEDPGAALRMVLRAALVSEVGHHSQDGVLTSERRSIQERVRSSAQVVVDRVELGVEILEVQLVAVQVPAAVAASYMDVISADEEKRTLVNEGEAYAAQVLPAAFGEAAARTLGAEGAALRSAAAAAGRVARMQAIHQGVELSASTTRYRLYAEAVERALASRRLVLAPAERRIWLGGAGHEPQAFEGARLPDAK